VSRSGKANVEDKVSEPQIQGSAAGPVDDECEQDDDQDDDHQPEEEHDDRGNCVPAYGSGSSHPPQLPGAARIIQNGLAQEPGLRQRNWDTSGIEDLLADAGIPAMEFVPRFTLSHPALSTTIVGTANPGHLAGNIAIAEKGPLPADLYDEAKKLLPQ
jgi:hypothetical protein